MKVRRRVKSAAFQRYRQLVRCLRLMKLLETAHLYDLNWLAGQMRVSTRTIRRDLAALGAAGVAVPHGRESDLAQ